MRKFFAIARREWLSYFYSPLGYIVLAAFWFVNGFIFSTILGYLSQPGARSLQPLATIFNNTFFWIFMLFFIPVITMRLISEERKSGSIETLLTSPVTSATIVLGKFAAAFAFYAVLWLPVAAYALILNHFMTIDLRIVLSSLLAVLLLGAYFLAVGTFASSLSKNQIVAAILGFVMIIVIFSAGLVQTLVNDPAVKDAFSYLTIWDHMDDFARGVVDTRHIVYYVSSAALFLYLAQATLEAKKGQ
ncbi:MAG TPA: ABC transporter permease [Thermoanaerobaculia bacterium]|jgi:ABC-2 type transport system permease protein|nr:ABC transporter permease [Thermoanaerobaculia bacterium]